MRDGGHRWPEILLIRVLEACNAGCFMCAFASSNDNYRFSLADAEHLVVDLIDSNIQVIRLTGGEPLLLPDIEAMIRTLSRTSARTSIITNGYLLPEATWILESPLDQIVVSLDGASAATHDRFRRLPGLFDRCFDGLKSIAQNSAIRLRVNTVVGVHNLDELPGIFDLLCELGVHQWSLIPIKRDSGAWVSRTEEAYRQAAAALETRVASRPVKPEFVGWSHTWLGRDSEEVRRLASIGRPMTPRGTCSVVDRVVYYTPREGLVFPCNCVPHRLAGREMSRAWDPGVLRAEGDWPAREWLRTNGSATCDGCEPANAALGEKLLDLGVDGFEF